MKWRLYLILGGILLSGNTEAGGFQTNLQGQRQIGMGQTGTGLAMDPASIFFNPGAMSHILQNGAQLGLNRVASGTSFMAPAANTNTRSNTLQFVPNAYFVWGPEAVYHRGGRCAPSRWERKDAFFKFGLGIYSPFSGRASWAGGWDGRFNVTEYSLNTVFIQPTVSFNLNDQFGFGVGYVHAFGSLDLQRSIQLPGQQLQEGQQELSGRGYGSGFNAGIYYRSEEKFSAGLSYRSRVNLKFEDGEATFQVPAELTAQFPNTSFAARMPLPASLNLGMGYRPNQNLTLAMDLQHVHWAGLNDLRFKYGTEINSLTKPAPTHNYQNAFIYRIGGEYTFKEKFAIRAGAFYDGSPAPETILTSAASTGKATGISGGFGYSFKWVRNWMAYRKQHRGLEVNTSFLFINQQTKAGDTAGNLPGTYHTYRFIPGISLTYKFHIYRDW